MALDFTLAKYAELCEAVLDSGYVPVTVAQHLAQPEQFDRVVLLRHDVDRWVENAVHSQMQHTMVRTCFQRLGSCGSLKMDRRLREQSGYQIHLTKSAAQRPIWVSNSVKSICLIRGPLSVSLAER